MSKKFYTIMIVPHAAAKFRRLKISRNFLIGAGCFLGLIFTAGLMFPHYLLRSTQLSAGIQRLARENSELKKASAKFDESLADLRGRLAEFEAKATKFAMLAGVEETTAQQMAAGGSSFDLKGLSPKASQAIIEAEINTLRERSGVLQDTFRVLDMAFQKQSLLLSSTPSIYPVHGLLGNGYGWRRDPFTGCVTSTRDWTWWRRSAPRSWPRRTASSPRPDRRVGSGTPSSSRTATASSRATPTCLPSPSGWDRG